MRMALIGCGLPIQNWKGRELGFTRQMDRVADECGGLRRLGVASLDMAYVAAGRQDGYWEHGTKIWDIAAGVLLVREAGGRVGRLEGDDELFEEGTVVAGNPEIYDRLRASLLEATPIAFGACKDRPMTGGAITRVAAALLDRRGSCRSAGWFVGTGFVESRLGARSVSVKGLAERDVQGRSRDLAAALRRHRQ